MGTRIILFFRYRPLLAWFSDRPLSRCRPRVNARGGVCCGFGRRLRLDEVCHHPDHENLTPSNLDDAVMALTVAPQQCSTLHQVVLPPAAVSGPITAIVAALPTTDYIVTSSPALLFSPCRKISLPTVQQQQQSSRILFFRRKNTLCTEQSSFQRPFSSRCE